MTVSKSSAVRGGKTRPASREHEQAGQRPHAAPFCGKTGRRRLPGSHRRFSFRSNMQTASNPLREGASNNRPQAKPCALVIFGATGDLTHRKLVPAVYNLAADGDLPPGSVVIGFARREKPDDVFRQEMEEATRKFSRQPVQDELWNEFREKPVLSPQRVRQRGGLQEPRR